MKRIQLSGITKRYPGTVANNKVSLNVEKGEIHALLGENGAGKSTLMKIIYGVVKPDEGEMLWEGKPVSVKGASHARELGIGMVFQHFSLFETLTVAENIALSIPKDQVGSMDGLKQRISEVSERYGMKLDPDRYVHTLSIGEQQRVEIVRCLLQDVKLLILDEPTSVLTPQEVETLFKTLQTLSAEGCSILFISHKLDEVRAICTGATILRGGVVTGDCNPQETTTDEIARLMVGDDTPLNQDYQKAVGGDVFLQVTNLSHQSDDPFSTSLKNITMDVRKGEILGIAGVAGNGQEELLDMIGGEELGEASVIKFEDLTVGKLGPAERRALGLGFVPEERLGRGAVPDMSLEDNGLLTAYQTGDLVNKGWINRSKVKEFANTIISNFKVKTPDAQAQAKSLSGGNLQKYIIGREILQNPKLLVCSHPTWGVDIGAAILIRHELIKLRDAGASILVVSEDIDELYQISDRICAICDGELSPVAATEKVSINQLGKWMAGDKTPVEDNEQAGAVA
ncbi:ABC transporter [Oleiphilus sp. HI0009]|nr:MULTISPECIES: ABC transporter ATP-binding protein [unclassified Oleiphilus]KZX79417.1 ABC transporter [Oleiphilus sp. HI0009]KZY63043.1 ABC transporter [Oleiphilus sp. HI0066]KZY75425.1 ABC transporter [Oleiphilus sp. HI0067]MCH2157462.1 ABC transporter ATP-binding protein [Oleiphilaceae bacterium]